MYGKPPSSVLNKAALAFDKEETEIEDLLYSCNILRHTTPGVHRISICMGTHAISGAAQQVLKTFCGELGVSPGETTADGQFYLEVVRCLGACDFGPSVMVDNEIHPRVSPDKVSSIIKSYS
ncbi:MAG: NAD(P)H-dependent oxidoreductase subunit E [Candidatus Syntrophopropionicum ammoniitolerans]